jgi:ABC-type multidrug transport system fused ATPase/permease subunit
MVRVSKQPFTRYFALLARYLRPQLGSVILMSVLLLVSIGLQLANPKVLGIFIDTTREQGLSQSLLWLALLYLLVSFLNQGASVASAYLCEQVAWKATNDLRADLLTHVLSLDRAFHKSHTHGELIERIDGDVNDLSNFFSELIVHMLFHLVLLVGMLVVLSWIDWRLGVCMGLYCLIVVGVLTWMRRPSVERWVVAREASSSFFGFLGEYLSATEDVRANGGMGYIWRHFFQRFSRWYTTTCHAGWSGATPWIISQALFALGRVLGLVLGAYLWSIGLASAGTVYLIFVYSSLLMQPLDKIQWQLQDLNQSTSCIRRIEALLGTRSSMKDGKGTQPAAGPLAVTFEDVSFGYDDAEPVLQHISFHLPAGRLLGIVGQSGGGKTTMTRLLFRMYDPHSGVIRLNGVAHTEMKLQDLRRRIGLITQDVDLFRATVRDNLTFFDREVSDERVLQVLEEIGLLPWYQALPQGLDTMLGAGGEGLSAGEAQLLAFARVFLTNPDLVVLDEASSRLDPLTEKLLERGMERLFTGRSGIIIAHRLETLQHVDDILVLEHGTVVEAGRREDLANDPNSRFSHLLRTADGAIVA